MEENQIQTELEDSTTQFEEPISVDNSENKEVENVESASEPLSEEGQSFEAEIVEEDPSEELILGKFKSVEDLTKINITTLDKTNYDPLAKVIRKKGKPYLKIWLISREEYYNSRKI